MDFFKIKLLDYIKANYLLLFIIIIDILGIILIFNNKQVPCNNDDNIIPEINEDNLSSDTLINNIYVDIKGAVKNPGVYELNDGAIVNDAVILAGGIKKDGSTSLINLSKELKNGMVIYVATTKEVNKLNNQNVLKTNEDVKISEKTIVVNDVKVTKDESVGYIDSTDTKLDNNENSFYETEVNNTYSGKVNINKSTYEQLMTIQGIGESKAKNIISYREENGPFKSIEDILNVSGIGQSIFDKIKEYIEV